MKKQLFTFFLSINSIFCLGQGMSKFEIWGWEGTKEEFREKYFEATAFDLNTTHSCDVELKKMGYEHSMSIIYLRNSEEFAEYSKGKLDLDVTERLTVVRQIAHDNITKAAADTFL